MQKNASGILFVEKNLLKQTREEASVGLNLREENNSILSLKLSFNDAKNTVERQSHSYELGPRGGYLSY